MTRRREKRPTVNDANLLFTGVPQRFSHLSAGVSRPLAKHATLTQPYRLIIIVIDALYIFQAIHNVQW